MGFLKRFTTCLLLLTIITASGVVNAKVVSGPQNLTGGLHQAESAFNALIRQAKIDFYYDAAPGSPVASKRKGAPDFDTARRQSFENAGMTDPSKIEFSKVDPKTGTIVEFKGPGGAKIGYDGPHSSPGTHHDTQHISWQSAGKRKAGGRKRGNIPYSGDRHPSRPDRKE